MDTATDFKLSKPITRAILRAGISPHFHGFAPLVTAAQLVFESGMHKYKLTGDIYPRIAKLYGTTPAAIERNIRTAISRAWTTGAISAFYAQLGLQANRCPSNSEFIAYIVYTVREQI